MFRFSRRYAQVREVPVSIQPNPQLKALRQMRLVLLVSIAIVLVALALFQIWLLYLDGLYPRVPHSSAETFFPWFMGFPFLLMMSSSLLINLRQGRYWRRIESLRFAALAEDRQLLADEQPAPDEALAFPVTITTRSTARTALPGVLIFLAVLGSYLFFSFLVFHQTWLSSLPYFVFAGIFVIVLLAISRSRSTLLVAAEGVRVPASGGYSWVSWNEMRLFACYRSQGSLKNGAMLTYELSTADAIIRWTWLQRPATSWSAQSPTLPFSEHTAQMQAVARCVVAKTGLPLYDLSKGQIGEFAPMERSQTTMVSPQRQRVQADAPATMICSNPLLGNLKMMRLTYMGLTILIVVMILFTHATFYLSEFTVRAGLSGFFTSLWSESSIPALDILLFLGLFLLISLVERYWKRVERLRFSAASGNERLRAPDQPQPDAEALSLPTTFTLRTARPFALFIGLAFFVAMTLFIFLINVLTPVGSSFFLDWPINLITFALLAGCAGGIYLIYSRRRTRIEVSENGIRMYQNKSVNMYVSWQEARLFVCYNAPLARRTGDELLYELSSGSSVVRWSWVQRPGSPWLVWAATTPFAEHRAHMQALMELIAARTGLVLYDLRREQ